MLAGSTSEPFSSPNNLSFSILVPQVLANGSSYFLLLVIEQHIYMRLIEFTGFLQFKWRLEYTFHTVGQ